ncbi:MAG: AsmA family protein [Gammaproteobacteria bacterium]|nr:AsmA family protein [Gammaproteobacteria bacterium]
MAWALSRSGRRTWLLVLGGAVLLVVCAALFVARHLQDSLVHLLERRSHHPIRIAGRFEAHLLSRHPGISAWDVEIGNPTWSGPGTLGHLGRVGILLNWRWAWPPLEIRRLELEDSEWHLRRDAQARANWTVTAEGAGAGPPLIRSLAMRAARVDLHDERRHLTFAGTVSAGDEGEGDAPALRVEAKGELNGRPALLRIDGEALATARRDQPWHFVLHEDSGSSRLSAEGYFLHPFDFREMEGSFEAAGPTLHDAYYLVGLKLPATAWFSASGHLSRRNLRFRYEKLRVTSGESDLGGALTVDGGSGPVHTTGELTSTRLRLADLGARDAEPRKTLPDSPVPVAGLRRSELRVRYRAQQLEIGHHYLEEVSVLVVTHAGELRIERLHAQLDGGELSGQAHLGRGEGGEPEAGVEVHLQDLKLGELLGADRPPLATGSLDGRVRLIGQGDTWRALADRASGEATIVIPQGSVHAALAEAASGEVAGALGLLRRSAKETTIRCAVLSLEAEQGVVRSRTLVLDTDAALLTGSGELHLDTQTLDARIRGRPKHPTLALHSAITVSGPLLRPHVAIDKRSALVQGGAAVVLGATLTPLAAALAFVDPGLTRDADCRALLSEASTEAHKP